MLEPGFKIERVLNASSDGPLFGLVRAFIKPQSEQTFEVSNEYICARLAHAVGVPCPPGDFAQLGDDRQMTWVSPLALQDSPPPVNPADIAEAEPNLCAGILVFDAWILNLDRHDWNIIHSPKSGTWAIDHGQALFYRGDDPTGALRSVRNQRMTPTHILAPFALPKDVSEWCDRVCAVEDRAIRSAIDPVRARGLIDDAHADAIFDFLTFRARNIADLVPAGSSPSVATERGVEA